jgi:hypothetical protein
LKLVEPHAESLLVTDTPYVTVTPGAPCCMAGETDTVGFRRWHEIGTTYVALPVPTYAGAEALVTRGTMA